MKNYRWIYQHGNTRVQTTTYVDASGIERCCWTKGKNGNADDYTVGEYLAILNSAREPGTPEFICLAWEELEPRLIESENLRHSLGEMAETTESDFREMLGVLPPMQWRRSALAESFKMSELTCGDITMCFVRIGSRYFSGYGRTSTSTDTLIDWAAMAYGKLYPQEYARFYTTT